MNVTSFACSRELTGSGGHLLLRRRLTSAHSLYRRDLVGHFGCVNAVEFSPCGTTLASGGDDHRVLLWDLARAVDQSSGDRRRSPTPFRVLRAKHNSNIFCLDFDSEVGKIFSGGNDEQVIVHDLASDRAVDVFPHPEPVYGLSSSPGSPSLFATACADGKLQLFDLRQPPSEGDPLLLARLTWPFHAVCFNPMEPRFSSI